MQMLPARSRNQVDAAADELDSTLFASLSVLNMACKIICVRNGLSVRLISLLQVQNGICEKWATTVEKILSYPLIPSSFFVFETC